MTTRPTRLHALAASLLLAVGSLPALAAPDTAALFDHDMQRLHSSEMVNLRDAYFGKPLLVINTASFCGYTGQF